MKHDEERRATDKHGNYLDCNTIANNTLKIALGIKKNVKPHSFVVCHLYSGTVYDPDHYTAIPNMILVPVGIDVFTGEQYPEIQKILQYNDHLINSI